MKIDIDWLLLRFLALITILEVQLLSPFHCITWICEICLGWRFLDFYKLLQLLRLFIVRFSFSILFSSFVFFFFFGFMAPGFWFFFFLRAYLNVQLELLFAFFL